MHHQCVPVDAAPPFSRPILRFAALALACLGPFAVPAIAQADDLIQLNGDPPVTLAGNVSYGLLYLDGVVRLAGDTNITATDVFVGPDASLQTCFDPGTNGNNCVAGRSLGIYATGGVAISPGIDLRGAVGPNRLGGTLAIRAGARLPGRRRSRRPARRPDRARLRSTRLESSSPRACMRPAPPSRFTAPEAS